MEGLTTIAARRTGDRVRISWDSQATGGGTPQFNVNKVERVNGQLLVGVSGRVRYANLLHRADVPEIHPSDLGPRFDGLGWLIDELVPAWMHAVTRAWERTPKDEGDEVPWGTALVVLNGGIFEIGSDFAVLDCGEFWAIGSGSPYAMTALHLGKSAKAAVEIAAQLDLFTGGTIREATA